MNDKKAQGLQITTVILAVLGVIVLLIIVGLVTGKLQWFGKGLVTCPGDCMSDTKCTELGGYSLGRDFVIPDSQQNLLDQVSENKAKTCVNAFSDYICCSSKEKAMTR